MTFPQLTTHDHDGVEEVIESAPVG